MDKWEVTVARLRAALRAGWTPPTPITANDFPLDPNAPPWEVRSTSCTFSSAPMGRETYALNCIDRDSARELCRFLGGDLPTEAQWEYVAQVLDRDHKTLYTSGDDRPTCETMIFGRYPRQGRETCTKFGVGAHHEDDPHADVGARGIMNFGGGMWEWLLDAHHSLASRCWARVSLRDPICSDISAPLSIHRGTAWASESIEIAGLRYGVHGLAVEGGLRCVRP